MYQIIQHFFPDLFDSIRKIEDCRSHSKYELAEIIIGCIAMFLFKTGSRNEMNNLREDPKFIKNYKKLFKLRLPHADTIHRVMKILSEEHLEALKRKMIQVLLNKKALHKYRFQGKFIVAIDGTKVVSFKYKHCEQCTHSTKGDKTTWFHNVLEAKLITPNGFALSLGTEWIENPNEEYDKQDCERKAFTRLAKKLKQDYPRLPICLTADSLYPYQGFFDTCKKYGWNFILTFKDGSLPSVWKEVDSLKPLQKNNHRCEIVNEGKKEIQRDYKWVTEIDYNGHLVHWVECKEKSNEENNEVRSRFVHLTDIKPTCQSVPSISVTGRLRWKIENEGFNAQKNQGYGMSHKYARRSYRAMKNYYQSLQIAHIINELLVLNQNFQKLLTGKMTLKHLWKRLVSLMSDGDVEEQVLDSITASTYQIRFIS